MPNVEKTLLEDNVYRISVVLDKDMYQKEFTKELKKYRKTAQWKGFRKGTAPLSFVKKMVGGQLFYDLINKMTYKALFDKIEAENINYIGSPIPAVDEAPQDIDMDMKEDIRFAYDLAVMPEFDVVEPTDHTFTYFKVNNLDELAKKEMEQAQLSLAKSEEITEKFDKDVTLTLKLSELDGDTVKEGGIENETLVSVKVVKNEDITKLLNKAKVGDTFVMEPFQDLDAEDEFITTSYLGMNADYEGEIPQKFQAEIVKATKQIPAELDQPFFDQLFGPGVVDSEDKALERFVEYFESRYNHEADQMLLLNWKKFLQEQNKITLPSEYIKKIILATNEGVGQEAIEKDLPLVETDLIWSNIRMKLVKKYEISEPTQHDIEHAIAHSIGSQYGIDPHNEIIMNIAKETIQKDQAKVEATAHGILEGRLFDAIKADLKRDEKLVSDEQFQEVIKETFESGQ